MSSVYHIFLFFFLAVFAHFCLNPSNKQHLYSFTEADLSAKTSLSEWANRGLRVSLFHTSKSPPWSIFDRSGCQYQTCDLSLSPHVDQSSSLFLVSPPQPDTRRHLKGHIFHQTCESLNASMFFQGSVDVIMCITTTGAKETAFWCDRNKEHLMLKKSGGYTDREMKRIETLWNRGNRKWHTVQYMTEQCPDNYKKNLSVTVISIGTNYEVM